MTIRTETLRVADGKPRWEPDRMKTLMPHIPQKQNRVTSRSSSWRMTQTRYEYNRVMSFLLNRGQDKRAMVILGQMRAEGLEPDVETHCLLVRSLVNGPQWKRVFQYLSILITCHDQMYMYIWRVAMKGFVDNSHWKRALRLLDVARSRQRRKVLSQMACELVVYLCDAQIPHIAHALLIDFSPMWAVPMDSKSLGLCTTFVLERHSEQTALISTLQRLQKVQANIKKTPWSASTCAKLASGFDSSVWCCGGMRVLPTYAATVRRRHAWKQSRQRIRPKQA